MNDAGNINRRDKTDHSDAPAALNWFGARHRYDAAVGLIRLGAATEALKELEPLLGSEFHTSRTEEVRLWAQSMAHGPAGICEATLAALNRGIFDNDLLQTGYIEALNTGRPMLALRFLNSCTSAHFNRPGALSCRACAAAKLGFHERALEDIAAALPREKDPVAFLIDAHLSPMWYHYASTAPRFWEAKILTRPEFAQLAHAGRSETRLSSICWYTAQTCLPRDLLPTLTREPTLYVLPGPRASLAERRRFLKWLNERRRRMARVLRRAIQRARDVMRATETPPLRWAHAHPPERISPPTDPSNMNDKVASNGLKTGEIGEAESTHALAPAGSHVGRCIWIIDLGTQTEIFDGHEESARKLLLGFEIHIRTRALRGESGARIAVVTREFTEASGKWTDLRAFLEEWRGRAFEPDERMGFDLSVVIGRECRLKVIHQTDGAGELRAEIVNVSLANKDTCPLAVLPTRSFSLGEETLDVETFNCLPAWLQDKIKRSPEYRTAEHNTISQILPLENNGLSGKDEP